MYAHFITPNEITAVPDNITAANDITATHDDITDHNPSAANNNLDTSNDDPSAAISSSQLSMIISTHLLIIWTPPVRLRMIIILLPLPIISLLPMKITLDANSNEHYRE